MKEMADILARLLVENKRLFMESLESGRTLDAENQKLRDELRESTESVARLTCALDRLTCAQTKEVGL